MPCVIFQSFTFGLALVQKMNFCINGNRCWYAAPLFQGTELVASTLITSRLASVPIAVYVKLPRREQRVINSHCAAAGMDISIVRRERVLALTKIVSHCL